MPSTREIHVGGVGTLVHLGLAQVALEAPALALSAHVHELEALNFVSAVGGEPGAAHRHW